MTVKLLLDEDVHLKLAESLRQYGIDTIHVQELHRTGQSDLEQLRYAVEQKRCIFTFNVGDFVRLHKAFIEQEREHYGIIVSKQLPIGQCVHRLAQLLQNTSVEQFSQRLIFL